MAGCITDSRTKINLQITNLNDGSKEVEITDKVDTPCLELLDQDYLQPWIFADGVEWDTTDRGILYVRTS